MCGGGGTLREKMHFHLRKERISDLSVNSRKRTALAEKIEFSLPVILLTVLFHFSLSFCFCFQAGFIFVFVFVLSGVECHSRCRAQQVFHFVDTGHCSVQNYQQTGQILVKELLSGSHPRLFHAAKAVYLRNVAST